MDGLVGASDFTVRTIEVADRTAVLSMMKALWGGSEMVVHDEVISPADLPGYIAEVRTEIVGGSRTV